MGVGVSQSRKFQRQWRTAKPGQVPPEWRAKVEGQRAGLVDVMKFAQSRLPDRAMAFITCPQGETEVQVEAIGYVSNIDQRAQTVELFHALEEYWREQGLIPPLPVAAAPPRANAPAQPLFGDGFKRRLRDIWSDFEAKLLDPEGVGDAQRQEMRRAFYAGAFGLQDALARAVSSGDVMTRDDEQMLEDLATEREEYLLDLKLRRA